MLAAHRNAGRMDLREARVGERRAALVGAPDGGRVASPWRWSRGRRRCRSRRSPSTTASARCGSIAPVTMSRATIPRARPSTTIRSSISVRGNIFTPPRGDLLLQRLVRAEQQLLPGLPARVERARDLRAAERAVGQQAAVLARERHALRHALVDDVDADLRQPVDVRLARAEVAALDRVVEQAVDAVAVVLVVLGGVDAALRRDAVRAPRRILEAEALDVVAELAQRRGGGRRRPGRCRPR